MARTGAEGWKWIHAVAAVFAGGFLGAHVAFRNVKPPGGSGDLHLLLGGARMLP